MSRTVGCLIFVFCILISPSILYAQEEPENDVKVLLGFQCKSVTSLKFDYVDNGLKSSTYSRMKQKIWVGPISSILSSEEFFVLSCNSHDFSRRIVSVNMSGGYYEFSCFLMDRRWSTYSFQFGFSFRAESEFQIPIELHENEVLFQEEDCKIFLKRKDDCFVNSDNWTSIWTLLCKHDLGQCLYLADFYQQCRNILWPPPPR